MRLSDHGVAALKGEEGLSLTAYRDPPIDDPAQQLWSIGYGHQLGKGPQWNGYTITRAQADQLFDQDRVSREAALSLLVPNATQQQFDAMTSLAYNIGTQGFTDSTVRRLHNLGDYAGAADAFRMWRKSAGQVNPVLVARRERERNIYLNGYGAFTPPQRQTPATPPPAPPPPVATAPEPDSHGFLLSLSGALFFCPSCGRRSPVAKVEVIGEA